MDPMLSGGGGDDSYDFDDLSFEGLTDFNFGRGVLNGDLGSWCCYFGF
jgi:hypothetical protein